MNGYDDVLKPFYDLMHHRLTHSQFRGERRWLQSTSSELLDALRHEVDDLAVAVSMKNPVTVMLNAAGVANSAMFIANRAMIDIAFPSVAASPVGALAPRIFTNVPPADDGSQVVIAYRSPDGSCRTFRYEGGATWIDNVTGEKFTGGGGEAGYPSLPWEKRAVEPERKISER